MKLKLFCFLGLACSTYVSGEEILSHFYTPALSDSHSPWFTGPLLAPSAHTVPPKHYNFEPYFFFNTITGSYDEKWNSSSSPHFYQMLLQVPFWVGINSFLDFTMNPNMVYQFTEGVRSVGSGDIPFALNIQLLSDPTGSWWPALKLTLGASFPFGKYDHLHPYKLGTDGAGSGSWDPFVILAASRIFEFANHHFFSPRIGLSYTVPTPIHVNDLNVYGGTEGTNGTVYGGNAFWCDIGFEYNITQNWVFAMDTYYSHFNKIRFSGNPGENASVGAPSTEGFSLAPAIEYNWSANIGMIGGVWFSIAGRNSARFVNAVLAFNVYI